MKKQADTENGQFLLFSEAEMDEQQEKLKDLYRKEFESKKYVFVSDDEEQDFPLYVPEWECKGKMQNDLFSEADIKAIELAAEDERQKKAQREKEKHENEVLKAYEEMVIPYFPNPKNDNEMLFNYQYDFIKNGNSEAWGKLLLLAFDVTKNLLWQWLRDHRDVFLDDIAQDEKTSEAVEYVLRRYKKNVGWCVRKNYIGALKGGVLHVMRYSTMITRMTSYLEDEKLDYYENQKST